MTTSSNKLRAWFRSVDAYVRKVLLEPGFVIDSVWNSEGKELRESGRKSHVKRYNVHLDGLFETIVNWLGVMAEGLSDRRFGDDWARLT